MIIATFWLLLSFIQSEGNPHAEQGYCVADVCRQSQDQTLWERNVERYCRTVRNEMSISSAMKTAVQRQLNPWWMYYWEPNWSCPFEERIMWMPPDSLVTAGDGGKWTCNAPALASRDDCLVYSFGSAGDFSFEVGLLELLNNRCEVHTFDISNLQPLESYPPSAFAAIHKHMWGLGLVDENLSVLENGELKVLQMKTLASIMQALNHTGRTLHILKVDIEGGEFGLLNNHSFWREFDRSGNRVEQLLFELHFQHSVHFSAREVKESGGSIDQFFRALTREGFVLFHKEINMLEPTCSEFSMMRLHVSCDDQPGWKEAVMGEDALLDDVDEEVTKEIVRRINLEERRWGVQPRRQ